MSSGGEFAGVAPSGRVIMSGATTGLEVRQRALAGRPVLDLTKGGRPPARMHPKLCKLYGPRPRGMHSVGPNFSHHKARVQAVGWFLLGTRKQGSRPFAAPAPPNRNGAGPKAGPASPPPPACPRTLTAGRHMVIEVPQGADSERQVCWDLGPAW